MVSVLVIWADITLTAYILGFFLLRRLFLSHPHTELAALIAGVAAACFYAQVFSIFSGVGAAAVIGLHILCALLAFLCKKELAETLRAGWRYLRRLFSQNGSSAGRARLLAAVVLILVFAAAASAGKWHTDTPLYHAQVIHWMETYGTVRGLGNLQTHFAYGNTCFPLYALYSFFWITGRSFHAVQGYLALLVALLCLLPAGGPFRYARIAAVCQLFLLFDELVSPSSDIAYLMFTDMVLLLWTAALSRKDADPHTYARIVLLGVVTVTVKLAAAPLLLLAAKPISMFVSRGPAKKPVCCLTYTLYALLVSLPFFLRNLLLSGWIIYPVLPQHILNLPWQIPDGVGIFEREEIRANGRMIFDMTLKDTPLKIWFGDWLIRHPRPLRILILLSVFAACLALLRILVLLLLKRGNRDAVFYSAVLTGFFGFWFFSSPQFRFGQSAILFLCASVYGDAVTFVFSMLSRRLPERITSAAKKTPAVFAGALALLLTVLSVRYGALTLSHPLLQQDYDRYPVDTYTIGDFTFYYPTEFVYTGYYAFPGTRWLVTDAVALGPSVRDGFAPAP